MNLRLYTIPYLLFLFLSFTVLHAQKTSDLTLTSIFADYRYYPASIDEVKSMKNGEFYTVLEGNQSIVRYDYKTGLNRTNILTLEDLPDGTNSIDNYNFNSMENKILVSTHITRIYRHSFESNYLIFDLISSKTSSLTDSGKQQLATFSPDGTKVAFVLKNNLFYKDLFNNQIVQVTYDGQFNQIINGAPDWVYEEEFSFSQGYQWSPDSRKLAYYRSDESSVRQFEMTEFNDLYPVVRKFKYPKAGEANSIVSIQVYDLQSKETIAMEVGTETDQYIPRILWSADPSKIAIVRLNRLQNQVDVLLADASSGKATTIFHEVNPRFLSGIDDNFLHFTRNGKYFIIRSEHSGFFQFYLYSITGELINPLTTGEYEVKDLLGIDEKAEIMYYTSNQSSVINMDVYGVGLNGKKQRRLTMTNGCNSAGFSANFKYYINEWSDANTPPVYSLHRIDGTLLRILEDNAVLRQETKESGFSKKEFIQIPVNHQLLNGYIIKPVDFDSTRTYPLFMCVYGGPESQDVINSWDNNLAWQQYLVKSGYIIACIDNRGTDGRGEEFRKCTYLQLGKLETEDQKNAALYLGNKSWIDENRIGIWGWSYGGYMTLLCLTKGAEVFKMGIAVAPVTNWRYYDNIYTERFMRKPQDNATGYDENSPINHAAELKGKLLLIHGTSDDNVHMQNSMEMIKELIRNNKQFEQFMYPNKNHGIYGGNTQRHLYTMMTDFILKNL